jgi:nucleotide-binding universal stress UspA family protein
MAFQMRRILVPIDGSTGATQAAAYAGELARLAHASVALLRVHSPEIYQLSVLSEIPPLTDFEYLEVMEKQMNDPDKDPAFASAQQALGTVTAGVSRHIVWGQPAEVICDFAKEQGMDLIVVGSRGRSAFAALVLGSTSSQVLHHAPCAVTVVR